jgi:hypothetical protein
MKEGHTPTLAPPATVQSKVAMRDEDYFFTFIAFSVVFLRRNATVLRIF